MPGRVETVAGEELSDAQAERRARIVASALSLARQGGFGAVQMREVASGAEVALGTLYRYFPSKEHLLLAIQLDEVRALVGAVEAKPPRGERDADRLKDVFGRAVRGLGQQPKVASAMIRALVTGEADLVEEVAAVRATTLEAMTAAFGSGALTERQVETADLLYHVWLSAMVGWVSGLQEFEWIEPELGRAIDRLVPDEANEDTA